MIIFIELLRALAACLITNSHYIGIYPTDILANGGLLGDVIFFAVSGYCLLNKKKPFLSWYANRLWRVYLPVVIATTIFVLLGSYQIGEQNFVWWFVYPTYYHFVASILLLYIPYYFIARYDALKKKIPLIALVVFVAYILVYVFAYDKTNYHIDNVKQPMILFLFFESMLLGAYMRYNDDKYRDKFSWKIPVGLVVCVVIYFAFKLALTRYEWLATLQIFNQVAIIGTLYFLFRLMASLDKKMLNMPKGIKKAISFIAKITLEIYVVQYVLIDVLRPLFTFPVNWLVITASIIISATVLHFICKGIYLVVDKALGNMKKYSNKGNNIG